MKQAVGRFSVADYIVFSATLLISAAIGIFYAIKGQTSTKQFLMADRSMKYLPIALSVLASFFSASTLLGTPAEIYQYGTMYWISTFGAILAPFSGAMLFGPMFFKIKVVSVFQYLELWFKSKAVRLFGAFLYILRATIALGIFLFGPSTALSAVTEFPTWAVIVVVGVVCTFYTSIGGLKAVIWTDVFQTLVMLAGMVAVLIKGFLVSGGGSNVRNINYEGKRIEFFNFDIDPRVRHTFWSMIIAIVVVWLPPYAIDQQMASLSLNGATGAPLIGLFVLGSCFTSTNWIGAIIGGAFGLGFSLWFSVGTYIVKPINFKLPLTTAGCNLTGNTTRPFSFADTFDYRNWTRPSTDSLIGIDNLYGLSYLWFPFLGTVSCVVIGLGVSYVTGATKQVDVDPSLQLRFFHKLATLFKSLPPSVKLDANEKSKTGKKHKTRKRDGPTAFSSIV